MNAKPDVFAVIAQMRQDSSLSDERYEALCECENMLAIYGAALRSIASGGYGLEPHSSPEEFYNYNAAQMARKALEKAKP